jgi:hypothetical protein
VPVLSVTSSRRSCRKLLRRRNQAHEMVPAGNGRDHFLAVKARR